MFIIETIQCSYCSNTAIEDGWYYGRNYCADCKKYQDENPATYIDTDTFEVYVYEINNRYFWGIHDQPGHETELEIPKYLYDALILYAQQIEESK